MYKEQLAEQQLILFNEINDLAKALAEQ